ncbi:hypothetical protein LEMA_P098820.1 [Plenodomus lingam JN3]|uniref:DUF7730 domain-containing protein n=1 Tax=Leptosphaeria maculans (strain JN3 / isolate v23.1.3 / race Av1-4-5-6-7-8) TaxID=985895 RepID=E5A4C8_LEPMJ|nr:hypothetical protein LEMA_P098820.1 [Plenodomus lingam JN3]CBX98473.1 hypothetical protein LEMA_P098820.1 [Plenodomus lingam JN3]
MAPIPSSHLSSSSQLIQLPREIRDLIYEYALLGNKHTIALESAIINTSQSAHIQNLGFYKRLEEKFHCLHTRTHRRIWSVPTFDLNVAFGTQDIYNIPKYVSMTYNLNRRCHSLGRPNVSLLRTNKQIHAEASELMYGRATFSFNADFALAAAFAFLSDRAPATLLKINRLELGLSEDSNMCGTGTAHYPVMLRATDSSVLQYAYNHYTDLCTLLSSSRMSLRHITLRINSNLSPWRQINTPQTAEEWLLWEEREAKSLRPARPLWIEPLLQIKNLDSIDIYWGSNSLWAHRIADAISVLRQHMLKKHMRIQHSGLGTAETPLTFRLLDRQDFSGTLDKASSLIDYTLHENGTWLVSKCPDEHWARETFDAQDLNGSRTRCNVINVILSPQGRELRASQFHLDMGDKSRNQPTRLLDGVESAILTDDLRGPVRLHMPVNQVAGSHILTLLVSYSQRCQKRYRGQFQRLGVTSLLFNDMVGTTEILALATHKTIVAGLALATHSVLYQGEWDNEFHFVLGIWMLALGGLAAAEYMYNPHISTIGAALQITGVTAAVYMGVLITAILIYRIFFHRLRHIPGPFLARFSKLYGIFCGVLPHYQYYKWAEKLHEQYKTDVIRTGPREVTVYTADAIKLVHGPNTRCRKGPWYAAAKHVGGASVHTTRDKEEHKQRRKDWDFAFNAKALRDYEPRLDRHALALMTRLQEQASQPIVRLTNWVNFYSFDVMGDVSFSRSFGMMEKGEEADVIKLLHASMEPLSIFGHITWGLNLITRTPFGVKALLEHIEWTAMVLKERKKVVPKERDIFSWLLDEEDPNVTPELNSDARLLVVAGSDTTAATLSWIAYELCKNPKVQSRLLRDINSTVSKKGFLGVDDVANIPYLDGVINEAMRLHPAVPSGVQRETPPEGITLPNGTYIPGSTIVWMPIHTIQRDPRYFRSPLTFLPERWTDEQPDAIIDKRAFMPFGFGAYSCVGQRLAMMELRSVTANLVRQFELSFAEGEDGSAMEMESRDCFTLNVGKLDVRLLARDGDKA